MTTEKAREYQREYQAKRRRICLGNGLCVDCRREHDSGKNRCDICREKRNYRSGLTYELRKAAGLCANCKGPRMENHAYCDKCNEKYRKRQQQRNPNHVIWRPGKAGRPPKWAVQKVLDLLDWSLPVKELVAASGLSATTIYNYKQKRGGTK
jgi:hypothetical protein